MNRLLTILLLATGTAYGQIDNPPSSVNIVDATATGRALITATNAAAGRGVLGGSSFGGAIFVATSASARPTLIGSILGFSTTNSLGFNSSLTNLWVATNPAAAATALGLGASDSPTFSNVTTTGTLTATGNVTLNGTGNLAPSQTASSGASLMTRELSDDRYSFSRWYSAADLLYLEQSTFIPTVLRGAAAGFSPLFAQTVVVLDVNTKWSLPIDYRVGGQVRVVSYWSDRVLTNSGGTNADIAVWTLPSAAQPTSNTISNNATQGTQIKTVFTANYGGTDNSRFYVVDQLVDFGTITNISATNPMQIKYVELQRRAADATDTSTNSIYLSGVHIYAP